jgi:hypothetical protein
MKAAFRQYLEDLEGGKVRSEDYYLELEEEIINIAYDAGFRDGISPAEEFNNDYFNSNYLE